jgi:hypothetical protein
MTSAEYSFLSFEYYVKSSCYVDELKYAAIMLWTGDCRVHT